MLPHNRGNVIDDWTDSEMRAAYERTYTPGSKTAIYYEKQFFHTVYLSLNKTVPPLLLKQRFDLEAKALAFPFHHYLLDVFDRKLKLFIEGGLIDQSLWEINLDNDPKAYKVHKESFSILTLGDLEAGFVVCVAPFLLSIFVFGFEWLPTLKNLMVYVFIFEKYYNQMKNLRY